MTLANTILYVIGGIIALVGLTRWWVGSRRNPMRDAPARPNRFGPETVGIAMLSYFLAAVICLGVADVASDPRVGRRVADRHEGTKAQRHEGKRVASDPRVGRIDREDKPGPPHGDFATSAAGTGAQAIGLAVCLLLAGFSFDGGVRRFLLGPQGVPQAKGRVPRAACLPVLQTVGSTGGQAASGTRCPPPLKRRATPLPGIVLTGLGLAVVSIPVCDALLWTATWLLHVVGHPELSREHSVIQMLLEGAYPGWGVGVLWLGAVVIAPLAEEVFFRGILQTTVATVGGRRWLAVACSATLFGVSHYSGQPQAVPALVALGIMLGISYERTGSLLAPILLHSLFNLKTLIWVTWVG